ncbi:MAG: hypothetical protein AAF716_11525 [Cyanobacteria bacterium P01_D01_bin.1]
MELQVIRDKLLSLKSESAVGDALLSPWAAPQSDDVPARGPVGHRTDDRDLSSNQSNGNYLNNRSLDDRRSQRAKTTPQVIAIEALRQRSGNHTHGTSHGVSDSSIGDALVSHELRQLEAIANTINDLSQQQTNELLQLKRSAQRAAISLRRQGVCAHPQLDIIHQFLEQSSSASVPNIEINGHERFHIHQTAINLNQAETEAVDNANTLRRQRTHQPAAIPFSRPVAPGPTVGEYLSQAQPYDSADHLYETPLYETQQSHNPDSKQPKSAKHNAWRGRNPKVRLKVAGRRMLARLKQYIHNRNHQTSTRIERSEDALYIKERNGFSWTDGIIWFVSAAIIRIILNALVINFSILKMPLLLILVGVISYAIYRIVLSKSTDMSATYRVGTALLGLFLGSLL